MFLLAMQIMLQLSFIFSKNFNGMIYLVQPLFLPVYLMIILPEFFNSLVMQTYNFI